MSESLKSTAPQQASAAELEGEEIDALPVLAGESHAVGPQPAAEALAQRPPSAVLPAVQAAAVAAGGFVAGAAVVGLVHRRRRRSAALGKSRGARRVARRAGASGPRGTAELVQVVGSRSFLVDVHLLGGSAGR